MIICDECNKRIKSEQIRYWQRTIAQDEKGDIVAIYFNCPHCQKKYTVTYINEEQKKLIQKRKRLQRLYKHSNTSTAKERYKDEEREIAKKQIKIAKELKERYKDE